MSKIPPPSSDTQRTLVCGVRSEGHTERVFGHALADVAEAEDPQGLVLHLEPHECLPVPHPGGGGPVGWMGRVVGGPGTPHTRGGGVDIPHISSNPKQKSGDDRDHTHTYTQPYVWIGDK